MATIAELLVKISANDQNLKKSLTSSAARVEKFANDAAKNLAKITVVMAAAVATATTLIVRSLLRTSEEIDKLAKDAQRLGIATEELQKLQYAASLAGVSADTLNSSFSRMLKNVSEAAKGTGTAASALKELGLDAQRLAQLKPETQFMQIAQAMDSVRSSGDKTRLVMDIFGREGTALLNLMQEDLKGTAIEFDKLGIAISGQQAAAVEAFDDAKTKLEAVWGGLKAQVMAEVAPAFTLIIDHVLETIKQMGGLRVVALDVATSIVSGVIAMIQAFQQLGKILDGIRIQYRALALAATKISPFTTKEDVLQQEDLLGQAIDKFGNKGEVSKLEGLLKSLQEQQLKLQQQTSNETTKAANIANKNNAATGLPVSGFGSITDVMTGKTISIGQPQKVEVQIVADKNGLVDAVVTDSRFISNVQSVAEQTTKDAARAVRR